MTHINCVMCHGMSCKIDNRCEECHDWSDDRFTRVSDYMHELLLQREKKHIRKAKAYSSSFSFFFCPRCQLPCQLPSPAGAGVVTTTPSSTVCALTFSAAAPVVFAALFFLPMDVTPLEPGSKQCRIESPREKARMLATFEDIWASGQLFSPLLGPLSALQPLLVTPPVPLPTVLALVLPAVFYAVSIALAATSPTRSATSSGSCERSRSRLVPVGPAPAPASLGSWPITLLVASPIPGPHLLPAWPLLPVHRPISHGRVHVAHLLRGSCRTARCQACGLVCLPVCRLSPRTYHGLLRSLVCSWTLSWLRSLLVRLGLRTTGGLLRLICPALVPLPVLQCLGAIIPGL